MDGICSRLRFLFSKHLEKTDTGSCCRLAIHKRDAEDYILPAYKAEERAEIEQGVEKGFHIVDLDAADVGGLLKLETFKFKRWPSSRTYVLIGEWRNFVKRRGLKPGHIVKIYMQNNIQFCMRCIQPDLNLVQRLPLSLLQLPLPLPPLSINSLSLISTCSDINHAGGPGAQNIASMNCTSDPDLQLQLSLPPISSESTLPNTIHGNNIPSSHVAVASSLNSLGGNCKQSPSPVSVSVSADGVQHSTLIQFYMSCTDHPDRQLQLYNSPIHGSADHTISSSTVAPASSFLSGSKQRPSPVSVSADGTVAVEPSLIKFKLCGEDICTHVESDRGNLQDMEEMMSCSLVAAGMKRRLNIDSADDDDDDDAAGVAVERLPVISKFKLFGADICVTHKDKGNQDKDNTTSSAPIIKRIRFQ